MARKRDTDDFQRIRHSPPKPRWDDDEPDPEASTYAFADKGPKPVPDWVITSDRARQHDLGILKTGKEADVHLVERTLDGTTNVLAAKRYRKFEDRLFRNDSRYRKGRRTGESRLDKAVEAGNKAGMAFRAQLWLLTEFDVLCRLWSAGAPVPYPVQKLDSEVMVELIGSPEQAAPRLVNARLDKTRTRAAWTQLVEAMHLMASTGVVHGDLSPYNILWHEDRIVIIDFPQAVDPIAHGEGMALLERDCANVCDWFSRRGVETPAPGELFSQVLASAF